MDISSTELTPHEPTPTLPYAREVVALFERGIEPHPYAWHGTSIEAILHLAKLGYLPASREYGAEFYYAPEGAFPEQEENAASYASLNGAREYMLQQLPFTPKDVLGLTFILTTADARAAFLEEAREHGMAEDKARQLWQDAAQLRKRSSHRHLRRYRPGLS